MSLRQAAGAVEDSLKSRTELIIQFLEEEARLHERTRQFATQFVEARFQYARDQDAAKRTAALERAGWDLLAMVTNPQEPFLMRWSAARYLSYEGARQDHADTLSWIPELPKLLGSGDTRSRLIAALLAGRRWLHREQAPEKGVVIPELIQGLSGETFQERDESYSVLVAVTERSTESFCVDPTDLPELRAKGIAVWERWWEANRDALAQERLPGRW